MASRLMQVAVVLACSACAVGCERVDSLGFTPVTGRVTLDGKPLTGGEVRFTPDPTSNKGPQSISPLGPDGSFELRGPGGRLGAVPGDHRVSVTLPHLTEAPTPPSEAAGTGVPPARAAAAAPQGPPLPAKYASPETSGLTATIESGKSARIDFELSSAQRTK
jgi:hypothetical protein